MKTWMTVLCSVAMLAGCVTEAPKVVVDAPPTAAEAPKVVVDFDQLEERDDLHYFEGKPFTGVVVHKYGNGQKFEEITYKDGKEISIKKWAPDGTLSK